MKSKNESLKNFNALMQKIEELECVKEKEKKLIDVHGKPIKCSMQYCDSLAVASLVPSWLGVHYCAKHSEIMRAFFKGNSSAIKSLGDIWSNVNVLKQFVESQAGKSFTCFELYSSFVSLNPSYHGGLTCEVYFKNCLRKLNVPCAVKGDGDLALFYLCVSPCKFKSKAFQKQGS